jgi:hypothetical protein
VLEAYKKPQGTDAEKKARDEAFLEKMRDVVRVLQDYLVPVATQTTTGEAPWVKATTAARTVHSEDCGFPRFGRES